MKTLTILFLSLLSFNQVFAQQNEEDKQPVTLEITKTGITCFGSADATVTISIFGGFAPYAVNGTPITGPFVSSEYVAVMWKTGALNSANAGALISVLDVNIFVNRFQNIPFIDNMLLSMNRL